MANLIKGKNLMVKVGEKIIGFATSCSLEISTEMKDIVAYKWSGGDASWKASDKDKMSWTVSSDHLAGTALTDFDTLFTSMMGSDPVTIQFASVALKSTATDETAGETDTMETTGIVYEGKAFISSLNVSAEEGSDRKSVV